LLIARCNYRLNIKWATLISVISQIEKLFPSQLLDIEFSFDKNNKLHIFQTRILKRELENSQINIAQVHQNSLKLDNYKNRGFGFFSNMSDWNPIEMLGINPKPFSISLYRSLISDKTWKESREYLGYYSPNEDHLIEIFCEKPYVNVVASLQSLTPDGISPKIREKVVGYAIKELESKKYLHDKIEFELALSSLFIDYELFYQRLKSYSLTEEEISIYKNEIERITINMFDNYQLFIDSGNKALLELSQFENHCRKLIDTSWETVNVFQLLLDLIHKTSKLGLFYFSIMARLAFVGDHLTKQLFSQSIISKGEYNSFYSTIKTIPSLINKAISSLRDGYISKDEFLNEFGHLRISTYDLLSPRYGEVYDQLFSTIEIKQTSNAEISNHLNNKKVFLSYSIKDILGFTKATIENREYFKFEFTKTISFIIEFAKKISSFCNIDISNFAYINLLDLSDLDSRELNKNLLNERISNNKQT